ncbi:MAG TPA: PEP-CTERM sorting domain-containing protein [Edaphobacter sp.]|jgi:hypothetical protein|nr:PEP-CTERM sorting domain-containing protein [Edaphobacter sp.]
MMKKMCVSFSMLVMVVLLGFTSRASADPIVGIIGSSVSFPVELDNTGNPDLYLNGSNFTIDSPLVLNDMLFANFPPVIPANAILDGVLFTVDLPAGMTPGLYNGVYSILGGFTPDAMDDLVDFEFQIDAQPAASPIPEPGTWLLLGTGLGLLGMTVYGRRRQASFGSAA